MPYFEFQGCDEFELMARELVRHPDYRVLRRLPRYEEIWLTPTPKRRLATVVGVLDTETTGLDPLRDKMVELAIVKMTLDDKGRLADITQPLVQLEDPGIALSPQIEQITGLTDADLYGEAFDECLIQSVLDDVDVLVAFNAPFDRAFMVRRFPSFSTRGHAPRERWTGRLWVCRVARLAIFSRARGITTTPTAQARTPGRWRACSPCTLRIGGPSSPTCWTRPGGRRAVSMQGRRRSAAGRR